MKLKGYWTRRGYSAIGSGAMVGRVVGLSTVGGSSLKYIRVSGAHGDASSLHIQWCYWILERMLGYGFECLNGSLWDGDAGVHVEVASWYLEGC
jgi:hypothetical protein